MARAALIFGCDCVAVCRDLSVEGLGMTALFQSARLGLGSIHFGNGAVIEELMFCVEARVLIDSPSCGNSQLFQ